MTKDCEAAQDILARNLQGLMERSKDLTSAAAIERATNKEVTANTVRNMLLPERGISPTVRSVAQVASLFDREAWELLHPNLQAADRQRALFQKWREADETLDTEDRPSTLPRPTANAPRPPTVHQPKAPYLPSRTKARKP